jgi:hypothetical protein
MKEQKQRELVELLARQTLNERQYEERRKKREEQEEKR